MVVPRLDAHDRMEGAVIGELLGVPGARCVDVASVADQAASYLATVVIPASRSPATSWSRKIAGR